MESMHSMVEDMMLRLQVAKGRLQVRNRHLQDVRDEREKAIQVEHINERLHTGRYDRFVKENDFPMAFHLQAPI